jgi:hypothetical protein
MDFPEDELEAYRERLNYGLSAYTTRVGDEKGMYETGVVNSPLGWLQIDEVRSFQNVNQHPFFSELTPEQKRVLEGRPYDVIKFSKSSEQPI